MQVKIHFSLFKTPPYIQNMKKNNLLLFFGGFFRKEGESIFEAIKFQGGFI